MHFAYKICYICVGSGCLGTLNEPTQLLSRMPPPPHTHTLHFHHLSPIALLSLSLAHHAFRSLHLLFCHYRLNPSVRPHFINSHSFLSIPFPLPPLSLGLVLPRSLLRGYVWVASAGDRWRPRYAAYYKTSFNQA